MAKLRLSKSFKKLVFDFAHQYGCKVRFVDNLDCSGAAEYMDGMIYISRLKDHNKTERHVMSTLFHEIGHCVAFREKKFKAYHYGKADERLTAADRMAIVRTGLRAEQYVDKWGEREFRKHFPAERYVRSYRSKEDKTWFHKNVLMDYLEKEEEI